MNFPAEVTRPGIPAEITRKSVNYTLRLVCADNQFSPRDPSYQFNALPDGRHTMDVVKLHVHHGIDYDTRTYMLSGGARGGQSTWSRGSVDVDYADR